MDRAIDARLRWLDGNLPRLVMPLNKCRTHGEEATQSPGDNQFRSVAENQLTISADDAAQMTEADTKKHYFTP